MKTYRLYQVDASTAERFSGNPAGVVANADGLTDSQMQMIARLGTVEVTVDVKESRPEKVRVGGRAVVVFKTELRL